MGEAYKDLAEVRYQQEARAKSEFFEPMRAIEKDLKEISVRDKTASLFLTFVDLLETAPPSMHRES